MADKANPKAVVDRERILRALSEGEVVYSHATVGGYSHTEPHFKYVKFQDCGDGMMAVSPLGVPSSVYRIKYSDLWHEAIEVAETLLGEQMSVHPDDRMFSKNFDSTFS